MNENETPQAEQDRPEQAPAEGGNGRSQEAVADDTREAELTQLREELDQMKDRALRALADLDNYRKRADRTIVEERRYACLPLIRDLLPVLDNLKRALEAAGKSQGAAGLVEGVEIVVRQLEGLLAKHHCTPIPALHQPFNPNLHEAILQQPSAEFPPNTVLQEVQTGFQLHDRVVRPSQVIVSSAPPAQEADGKPA